MSCLNFGFLQLAIACFMNFRRGLFTQTLLRRILSAETGT